VRTIQAKPNRIIWRWVTLTLMATASLSSPFLIDGISYTKVFIALVMTSCIMPSILMKLLGVFSSKLTWGFFLLFLLMNLYLLYLSLNSYRSVFGAPGRHNGFLSAIVCMYFFVIGIYVQKFCTILDVYKTISFVSASTSLCILLITEFKVGANSVFASNNFMSSTFGENTNLIAPLMCVGFVSSIITYRKTKNSLFLIFLIPLLIVAVKLSVIQVYLVLGISLLILGISSSKRHFRTAWLPVVFFTGYLVALFLAFQGVFDKDSSIKERTDILREAVRISREFTFLPRNIDGLSDFTENFSSFSSTQFLDDFHNVFLQVMFSFGLVLGLFFLLLAISPYFVNPLPYRDKVEFLSVYTSLLTSLLIGISSPNYIYIFFLLLGYSSVSFFKSLQVLQMNRSKYTRSALSLSIMLVLIPVYVQLDDFNIRFKISDRTSKIKASNSFTNPNFNALVRDLNEIDDAGYRNRIALNFYAIGECKYGDLVYVMMAKNNPNEARLRSLAVTKKSCPEE
jgi:hypothetical protein